MSDSTDTIDLPYLRHLKWDETVVMSGNRKTPTLLYVTRGPKNDSLIWHCEENGKFFQYRQYSCSKKSVELMCIYSKNKRSKCPARLTVEPLKEGLIYARKINNKNRLNITQNFKLN